jgi:TonB-dependent receptor
MFDRGPRLNGLTWLFTIVNGSLLINPAYAGDASSASDDDQQVITVTGWKRSLRDSADIKRNGMGIVDAISAQDIDRFPDTNLGEALQRITGISIERRNGEGTTVTARGFGPDFNLITLNGRQLAAADGYPGAIGTGLVFVNSRSFNFANLATEGVKSLEVHKTGEAAASTGGIGATIDIRTVRPLDNPGTRLSLNALASADQSQIGGSTLTPQFSGIFSYSDNDQRWGVSLAADYQRRESGASDSNVTFWDIKRWHGAPTDIADNVGAAGLNLYVNNNSTPDPGDDFIDATVANAPGDGQLYGMPSDIRYSITDRRKQRINGLLTVQFAANDALTLTADYFYARADLEEDRSEQTVWWSQAGFRTVVFDTGAEVATPLFLSQYTGASKDFGFDQQHRAQLNQLDAVGLNAEYKATDRLSLFVDLNSSEARSLPNDALTGGNMTDFSTAGRVASAGNCTLPSVCTNFWTQEFRMNEGLPLASRTLYPTNLDAYSGTEGDPDFTFDSSTLGSQVLRIYYSDQRSKARQAKLDARLDLESSRLGFGVEARSIESQYRRSGSLMNLGDWGIADAGRVPGMVKLLTPVDLSSTFDDYPTNGVAGQGFSGNANRLAQWAVTPVANGGGGYGIWAVSGAQNGQLRFNPNFPDQRHFTEETQAAYLEWNFDTHIAGRISHLRAGARYEQTEVDSAANLKLPRSLVWVSASEFLIPYAAEATHYAEKAEYDDLLPSFDLDVELTSTVKARLAWGRTIARQPYAQLLAGAATIGNPDSTTLNGGSAGASAQNPGLLPLESDNIDLSVEWYFADDGYLAATAWDKRVSGFAVTATDDRTLFNLKDPTGGPRALAAREELQRRGFATTDAALFTMVAMTEHASGFTDANGVLWPGGAAAFDGTDAQRLAFAQAFDVLPAPGDPEYVFTVSRPVNGREAHIHGWELAAQCFFGNSGIGAQANYTRVLGDIHYDVTEDPSVDQFVLPGLSDTANVALIYEKSRVSARLAWNWRDGYLQSANVDDYHSPAILDSYAQLDLSASYSLNEHLQVSLEGINLNGENVRAHGRASRQLWMLEEQAARYSLGVRYRL